MSPDPPNDPEDGSLTEPDVTDRFTDEHYPAYTMGRAAEMLGVTAGFLRRLDEANLISPERSSGGHRRYTRQQLRAAARIRELLDEGMNLDAAWRIITLQNQLQDAHEHHEEHHPHPNYPDLHDQTRPDSG